MGPARRCGAGVTHVSSPRFPSGWPPQSWFLRRGHLLAARVFGQGHYIPAYVTIVLLVAVVNIPLRPMHTLSLGLAIEVFHLASYAAAARWGDRPASSYDFIQHVFILIVIALCTALTMVIYTERASSYHAHQQAVVVCRRAVLSESAASLARLAATLSHEFNSPLGSLRSAVDTLAVAAAKRATAPPFEPARLVAAIEDKVRRSALQSVTRLHEVVLRMQRFTNLDRAEVRPTDLNELLNDVVCLLEPQVSGKASLEFDPQPLPPISCHT